MKKTQKKSSKKGESVGFIGFQFLRLLVQIINKVFHSRYKRFLKPVIEKLYRAFRYENFAVKSEIVQVKKGRAKYKLVIVETADGTLKVNIGRHDEKTSEKPKN